MGAMLAVIVVVISLTAFLSFLALSLSYEHEHEPDVPLDVLGYVRIVDGKIEADIEEKMNETIERYGYEGMTVILVIDDGIYDSSLIVRIGTFFSDNVLCETGTFIVKADNGRSVPVGYSVAVIL